MNTNNKPAKARLAEASIRSPCASLEQEKQNGVCLA
jgi:hypothetical protein